ncbi:hypothetical protein ER308_14210 [Egibacter rhizosphaerae]|uniref:Mycothiol-dependent maleylpyruvate isomerase metal-binding domain-containing protein n=1 Tax=Egibacter rhizosphaerae TaxID=1670831 RepID=A0A411YH57_9ACTN|nr:hypothetical protein [Egibacter rhizosphaerae]QBI20598.1 hypothetical protein ER308_14210 [Egibacter rhizosphaerae]
MDTSALETGYRELLETARAGGFGEPGGDGSWTADRVLAHVVASARLLGVTTAEVGAGTGPTYDNAPTTREAYLDAIARAAGGWDGLLSAARAAGLELVYVVRALGEDAAASPVPTRIVDGDTVRVEAPMPWSGVLNTHAEVHLPEHRARLEALRPG